MDWKSHRIDALLEQALVEDQAIADATTNLTIDANLRATASILAKEDLVVSGLGAIPRFLEIFARLDPRPQAHNRFEVVSHPEMFDGVRVHKGQVLFVIDPGQTSHDLTITEISRTLKLDRATVSRYATEATAAQPTGAPAVFTAN